MSERARYGASAGTPLVGRGASHDALLLGVAGPLASRLGASPLVVRAAFVVLGLAAAWGIGLYAVLWFLLHDRDDPAVRSISLRHNLGVVAATVAQVVAVDAAFPGVSLVLLWPVSLIIFALTISDSGESAGGRKRRDDSIARTLAGIVLMVGGLLATLAEAGGDVATIWRAGVGAIVLLGGLGLVLAPWLQKLRSATDHERRQRIRAEERSDLAAHLHDSVLQTLTLIQNRADDPEVTAALAHQQERELRHWLYAPGSHPRSDPTSLRAALESVAAEVEDQYLKLIECIIVGDATITPESEAVLSAAREAMVNAAKFAEIPVVSVYAEINASQLLVFVRDRGIGFEPATVPDDRRGLRDSIRGRVERVGGSVLIRSAPGEGTEVRIEVRP